MRLGLIPAHAGKTPAALTLSCRRRAHPRSRGENPDRAGTVHCAGGSSPLTRGKHEAGLSEVPAAGLIPAHAGKTGHPPS